jgi:2-dehydropantoate 2-reductase
MNDVDTIYVLGAGAVGLPLAAYLAAAGKSVMAVRTSQGSLPMATIAAKVRNGEDSLDVPLRCISLSEVRSLDGVTVVTAKSYANDAIAAQLSNKSVTGPVILLQNGVGIEKAFLQMSHLTIYRCVLYVTGQRIAENDFSFHSISPSPIGVVRGTEEELRQCIDLLTTGSFPFRHEPQIDREIWRKAIINSVFNSVCPLLEVDNGVFTRSKAAVEIAREVVSECLLLTERLSIPLTHSDVMEQLLTISKRSDGQMISTLQDIRAGRETEIRYMNLEIASIGSLMTPPVFLPRTELLGKMVLAKSRPRT